jgi:hypothetical protein
MRSCIRGKVNIFFGIHGEKAQLFAQKYEKWRMACKNYTWKVIYLGNREEQTKSIGTRKKEVYSWDAVQELSATYREPLSCYPGFN